MKTAMFLLIAASTVLWNAPAATAYDPSYDGYPYFGTHSSYYYGAARFWDIQDRHDK